MEEYVIELSYLQNQLLARLRVVNTQSAETK